MKKFAVAHINFFDNDLKIDVVSAPDWKEALITTQLSSCKPEYKADVEEWLNDLPDDIEEAKGYFFNCDQLFEVYEL